MVTSHVVHVWDLGMLCRFFYTPGGAAYAGVRFAKVIARHAEDAVRVVLCADTPRTSTWRHELFAEYKGHRPNRPEDEQVALEEQHRELCERTERFATVLRAPRYEADDIVATVSRRVVEAGLGVVVFSTDKDMAQLIGPDVHLHDGHDFVTPEHVRERFGVECAQVGDFLAIAGDACDGVPGVRGLGPKAAAELLNAHGTLEGAYEALELRVRVGERVSAAERKFVNGIGQARLSRMLVELRSDVPIRMPWEEQ
jgi:5'-3' exonuclease